MEKYRIMLKYSQEILTTNIFEFIFKCAMHDAVLQQAFKVEKNWIGKVTEAQTSLSKYIDKILKNEFKTQKDHDDCFLKTANAICKLINDKKTEYAIDAFSFGNAPKLINMTVKYYYSICYFDPEERYKFKFCHCPLDPIMVNEIWEKYREEKWDTARRKDLGTSFCKSWGDEGLNDDKQPELTSFPDRYNCFQKSVKTIIGDVDILPIEFDFLIWKQ